MDYEVVLACEDLIARARSAPAAVTQVELLAYLALASSELRHANVTRLKLEEKLGSAFGGSLPPAVVVGSPASTASKCRHEFVEPVPGAAAGTPARCARCFAPKKANGRPKKEAASAPAPVDGGTEAV